jgi:hypothetical protein
MARVLRNLVPLIVIAVFVFAFKAHLYVAAYQVARTIAPCRVVIPYRILDIDPRFGISKDEIRSSIEEAVSVWEDASKRNLFKEAESDGAVIDVRFVYDARQETTETLKELDARIDVSTEAYERVQAEYKAQKDVYEDARTKFEERARAYDASVRAYENAVNSWNQKGGAPQSEVARLNREKNRLETERRSIEQDRIRLNTDADELNSVANRLNSIAHSVNATADTYNTVGLQSGKEFEEGLYTRVGTEETITIFEFDSQETLVRLLAHEFGHALRLEHVEGKDSIMHRLNSGSGLLLSEHDRIELSRACRV